MQPNMLLNIVGISLILIALVGIATYDPDEEEFHLPINYIEYELDFQETGLSAENVDGLLNDGGSMTYTVDIEDYNLTYLEFVIQWDDQNPRPILRPACPGLGTSACTTGEPSPSTYGVDVRDCPPPLMITWISGISCAIFLLVSSPA